MGDAYMLGDVPAVNRCTRETPCAARNELHVAIWGECWTTEPTLDQLASGLRNAPIVWADGDVLRRAAVILRLRARKPRSLAIRVLCRLLEDQATKLWSPSNVD